MPTLPSGRRIEFSLDRFHALLSEADPEQAKMIAASLTEADDLLFVMDVVHFGRENEPFFAGCTAAEWETYAADWSSADRQALLAWFGSDDARERRAEAIDYIKALYLDRPCGAAAYPYLVLAGSSALVSSGPARLQ